MEVINKNNTEKPNMSPQLEALGVKILSVARDELYLGMHFLDIALSSFLYVMDWSASPYGTDGQFIYFHPRYLGGVFKQNRILVNRGYLHMVLHCLFRHLIKSGQNRRYWDLSCDIAVEHLIDGKNHRSVRFSRSRLRREIYRRLEAEKKVLNAERIYKYLLEWNLPETELVNLEQDFYSDDHHYWANHNPDNPPDAALNQKWQDISEKMETFLETFSKEAAEKDGGFLDQIKVENQERHSYQEFLRKFSVLREEVTVDEDTFDYNFYTYGLRLYGNMPLVEPQETKEVQRVMEFAVVIDTSMSCSGELIQKFLEETYGILSEKNSFFKVVNIHIIQCDEAVQCDQKITSMEELKDYMEHFKIYGEGGTDFRPAFIYMEKLRAEGVFEDLKGLIYFTDGYGTFPQKMPPYQTAFVFLEEDYQDVNVPPWAMKLILQTDEL